MWINLWFPISPGRNLLLPADRPLRRIHHHHVPGLLPDDRHRLVLRFGAIVQERETDDGQNAFDLLSLLLDLRWTVVVVCKDAGDCVVITLNAILTWISRTQSLWIFSLINYKKPTYHNGHYEYPEWAHALGWTITAIPLVCIPGYAIISILRAEGETFLEVKRIDFVWGRKFNFTSCFPFQRFKNAIQPNIYECKICGEHHCEHDFPDEHSVQEMTPIIQSTPVPIIMRSPQQQRAHLGSAHFAGGRRPHMHLGQGSLKTTHEDEDNWGRRWWIRKSQDQI